MQGDAGQCIQCILPRVGAGVKRLEMLNFGDVFLVSFSTCFTKRPTKRPARKSAFSSFFPTGLVSIINHACCGTEYQQG